ncbi:receptor-like protein 33 [Capsicum annuum]
MGCQQLLIAFCFYSLIILFVQQSQLTCFSFAGQHLCACDEGDCLDLSWSCITGTINANSSLTKLGHLQRLNLAFNYLDYFPLGNNIGEHSSLTHLNLSHLGFNVGEMIPPGLLKVVYKLISLDISNNYYTLQVSKTNFRSLVQNLTNYLQVLLFDSGHVQFELPKNFSSSFRKLSLQDTGMFGDISDSQLFHLPNLQVLRLGWNPLIIGTLPNFNWSFSGSILELDFSQTGIFGKVPDSIGNLHSLWSYNILIWFHGEIPSFLPTRLQYLGLYGNQFGGQVPRSLANCTRLKALDLGTFPIWLEKLPNLQVMILKSNLFHGPIGGLESKFPFPELRIFDLSFNGFTGTLPSNLFKSFSGLMDWEEEKTGIPRESNISPTDYLYRVSLVIKGNEFDMRMITSIMTSIDLSSNRFEGDIPNSIGSLSSLVLLNVPHNNFHGYIPEEIAKLHALEALDLSWNKLIGEIPGQLSSLTFLEFNTFSNDSYRGNPDLCGCPLSKECGNNNVSDEPPLDQNDDSIFASRFTWQSVVIGYGCGMIFGLFIGGLMCLLDKPKVVCELC